MPARNNSFKTAIVYFPRSSEKRPQPVDFPHYFLSGETGEEEGHLFGIDGERGRWRARSALRSGRAYGELEANSGTLARLSSGSVVPP